MRRLSINLRRFTVATVIFCLGIFAACENSTGGDTKSGPEKPTGSTFVKFTNLEQFKVTVYRDSFRQQAVAEVPAQGSVTVAHLPTPSSEITFYPTFHLDIFDVSGISIPYNGQGIVTPIEADTTNSVTIPKLESIQIDSAFIKITNNSVSSLTLRQGNSEESPLGGGSKIVISGQSAVYQIAPGPSSGYSIMHNTITPVAFPANLTEFKRGIIYVLTYNGTNLTLIEERSVLQTIPPSAPENVNAEVVSSDSVSVSVRITWDAVYGATSYRIYRATSAEGAYSRVDEVVSDTAFYTDTDTSLSVGQVYYYKISAVSGANMESAQSTAAAVIMPPDNVRVTATTANSVSLEWKWNAVRMASGCNVYRSDSATGTYNKINTAALNSREFTDTGLSPDTTYWYKISMIVDDVEGFPSIQISASTSSIPGNVRITSADTNRVVLAWNVVPEASGYNVYRSDSENGTYSQINTGAVTGTEFTDTNVLKYTTYFYKVSAVINGIEGIQSSPVSTSAGVEVPGSGLTAKLNWLQTNAISGFSYTVEVTADESIGPTILSYIDRSNITITLTGVGSTRTVSLSSSGSMFTVSDGVTLVLDNNITLQGRNDNNNSLVIVSDGTLVMNDGATITGNSCTTTTTNESSYSHGGGVYVTSNGTFTMSGGKISGNSSTATTTIRSDYPYSSNSYGGGVCVASNGTFTMSGGEISGNSSTATTTSFHAYSYYSNSYGGGVYVDSNGTFTMSGGEIFGNINYSYSNSSSLSLGGGVYVKSNGTFTMSSGTISGNISNSSGGGVYIERGNFTKTGGTIYGYSASDTANSNVVKDRSGTVVNDRGHAIYVYFDTMKRKETTAGPMVNLSFNVTGSSTASWSGEWDN